MNGIKKKNQSLQGIRGLAIIMIFLAHTQTFIQEDLTFFSNWGGKGVYIFLVISGILLFENKISSKRNWNDITGFSYATKKISKLYWLHLVTYFVVLIFRYSESSIARRAVFSVFNLTLTQSWIPFSGIINSFNGPSWYLSMCFFIWLLTPKFMSRVSERIEKMSNRDILMHIGKILLALLVWLNLAKLIICLVDHHVPQVKSDWFSGYITYSCPLLCFGIYILAFWLAEYCKRMEKLQNSVLVIATIVAIVSLFLEKIVFVYNIPFIVAITILIISVIGSNESSIVKRFFESSTFVWFGNLSSYIFLIHGPVNFIIRDHFSFIPVPIKFVCSLSVTLLFSIGCAWLNKKIQSYSKCKMEISK